MSPLYPAIPAPPLLLSHLLGGVFLIHVVFLDFVMASPLVALWYLLQRRNNSRQYSKWLSSALPVAFTFVINFGVASLLFVQALFAERFYTANVFLGIGWLAVIGLLMLTFYGAYIARNLLGRTAPAGFRAGIIYLLVAAMVLGVAAIMIANYFLTGSQDQWPTLMNHPWGVLSNQTVAPRLLHFIAGAFAVTGFWMVWISRWREKRGAEVVQAREFRRNGLLLAAGATGMQIVLGVWFLLWLPSTAWDSLFNGGFPGVVWISGVATGLIMLGVLIVAVVFPNQALWQRISTALLICTLGGMVAGRDVVRLASFGKDFHVAALPSSTQPSVLLMFGIVVAAGVLTALWLFAVVRRIKPADGGKP